MILSLFKIMFTKLSNILFKFNVIHFSEHYNKNNVIHFSEHYTYTPYSHIVNILISIVSTLTYVLLYVSIIRHSIVYQLCSEYTNLSNYSIHRYTNHLLC